MTNSINRRALVVQSNFSPFGNKLVQSGYVDPDQMSRALAEHRQSGRPLMEVLAAIAGKEVPPELVRQYKKQLLLELKILHGVEAIDPEIEEVSAAQVEQCIETLIPVDVCRRYRLLPLGRAQRGDAPAMMVAM